MPNFEINALINEMESFTIEEENSEVTISIYYGDTSIINQIQWVPYIEFGFAIIVPF